MVRYKYAPKLPIVAIWKPVPEQNYNPNSQRASLDNVAKQARPPWMPCTQPTRMNPNMVSPKPS